jgi:hypothetical protein|tara:strand:- start:1249 stop:1623 length:375 start_codon:yes stop_codon:yes gene_type:complete
MKKSSEKSFGILFFIVFLLIAIWPLFGDGSIRYWSLVLAFIFFGIALLKQELLKPLNIAWIKFGEILGKVIAPIVMALVFFIILTPTSIIVRLFGKDLLKLKFSKDSSYWIKREKNITSMDKQF